MKNFGRALKIALGYRFTVIGAFTCSIMVAILWGANITAIYPFIEVVFQGKSMHAWVEGRIEKSQGSIGGYETEIAKLEQDGADKPDADRDARRELSHKKSRLNLEHKALGFYQWLAPWIDKYFPRDPFLTLVGVVMFLLVGTLLKDAFLVAHQFLVARLTGRTTLELRRRFFRHTLTMDLGTLGKDRTGTLMSHFTNDLQQVVGGMGCLFGEAMREPLKMIVCIGGAAFINWRLLLFSFILTPVALYFMKRLAERIRRSMRQALEEMSVFYNRLSETFAGVQLIKAYNLERHERQRYNAAIKTLYRRQMHATLLGALSKPYTELLGIGVICLALLAGGYLVIYQETSLFGLPLTARPMTFGSLMIFFGFLAGVSDPARKMTAILGQLAQGAIAADRLFPLLDRQPAVVDPAQPRPLPETHAELIFDDVSFHYQPGEPVLKHVNLKIPYGQCVAIVGPNGCGKSTLANLILRFYDPTEGRVRLDYTDLKEVRQRDLRDRIAIVTQQPHLFDDSVLENIRYGSLHATDDEVIAAAKQAHAHKFIEEVLELGYHTNVGERGGRLSGGQRQRIALARAIVRDPQIMLLDEATSQIDPESEVLIHKALEQFIKGRTTIMITHRLSTLALADRIIVMDAGQIVGDGRHSELLASCDLYRRLHQTDFRETA